MRINRDTNLDSFIGDVDSLINGINSAEKTYNASLSNLSNTTSKISFVNVWSDPVQEKVEEYVGNLKSDTTTIDNDITSGNFQSLKKKLNELKTEANTLKSAKETLEQKKSALAAENKKEEKSSSTISSLNSAIKSLNAQIDNSVSRINTLLSDISSIEFNKKYTESELPVITITEDDTSDDEQEEEEQEEEPTEPESSPTEYYNRTYEYDNMTIEYSTDENGRPVCKVTERNKNGQVISEVTYEVDETGHMKVNGQVYQEPSSQYWDYQFIYVTVKKGDKTVVIPVLTNPNVDGGMMFTGDKKYLEENGVDYEDYRYGYNYGLGTEETSDGKTVIVDTEPHYE
jgi:DNA repair exonuclease SbcCD ATPase subunit